MTTATALHVLSPGGRACVRRVACAVLLAASLLGASASPARAAQGSDLQVQERDGVFSIATTFDVPQAPGAVLAVLTDYEGIPRIAPDITRSVVLSRQDGRTVVEQQAVSRVMFFSKTVHLRLEIHETASSLHFRDTCGRSFTLYEGAWRVSPAGTGTRITYELRARPAFEVPDFLVKRLFRRDAAQLIARLRQAMSSEEKAEE